MLLWSPASASPHSDGTDNIGHVFDSETQCNGFSDILSAKRRGGPILSLLPAVHEGIQCLYGLQPGRKTEQYRRVSADVTGALLEPWAKHFHMVLLREI